MRNAAVRKIMNVSTTWKSAVAAAVKDSEMRVRMEVRCVAVLAALVFASFPAIAVAQPPCPGIHVKILDIRNSTGAVACALFESQEGFPTEFLHSATNIM